jgi:hypothetical protein
MERVRAHMLAHLVCLGRRTVTGLITTTGSRQKDWTAHYSMYSNARVDPAPVFQEVRRQVESLNGPGRPLCVALDDTIIRKTGTKIPGASFRRDPLGPKFQVNLVRSLRWLQISAVLDGGQGQGRMVPVGFKNASTPAKPPKSATPEQTQEHAEKLKQRGLNTLAVEGIKTLQQERTAENGGQAPPLHVVVDGSFTNKSILPNLPANTALVGRIRKDAKLFTRPECQPETGRKRIYGKQSMTPEQLRQDENIPWQKVRIQHRGKMREVEVKVKAGLRWRPTKAMDLLVVVIRPVGYLKKKGARKGYTQPGYLVCTDLSMPLDQLLEEYLLRWDIEVNHRDEKAILGVGQAQVRNETSVDTLPAMSVASYSMLLVAAAHAYGQGGLPCTIQPPSWRKTVKKSRPSTQDLVNELRLGLWAPSINARDLDQFLHPSRDGKNYQKPSFDLCSPLFCMN